MPATVSEQHVVLNDHKDLLIHQFRLLETLPSSERNVVRNYLTMMWRLSTIRTEALDTFNVGYRYIMESEVTGHRYGFIVQMDPIQGVMVSIDFEGIYTEFAA